jgi:hypothetical protein
VPPRHRLDAVLAAGELGLERDEIDHLRQRQRHHGEIDALAANGEPAEDGAERGRHRRTGEDAQQRLEAPDLDHMRGDVGRRPHEGGMAEREQPDVADKQVEGAGEEREAQRFHQEDGVELQGRDDGERQQADGESRGPVAQGQRRHGQTVLPKKPAGFTRSTTAMTT